MRWDLHNPFMNGQVKIERSFGPAALVALAVAVIVLALPLLALGLAAAVAGVFVFALFYFGLKVAAGVTRLRQLLAALFRRSPEHDGRVNVRVIRRPDSGPQSHWS